MIGSGASSRCWLTGLPVGWCPNRVCPAPERTWCWRARSGGMGTWALSGPAARIRDCSEHLRVTYLQYAKPTRSALAVNEPRR
jgi:hypothetical protein